MVLFSVVFVVFVVRGVEITDDGVAAGTEVAEDAESDVIVAMVRVELGVAVVGVVVATDGVAAIVMDDVRH